MALEQRVMGITRPDAKLFTLYLIYAIASLVAFPFVFLPLYFRYHTLRFRFEKEGVGVSYGILFRQETYLTYSRIQDIHLTRNLFERWLGIGTVEIQTASGRSGAEVSVPGTREFEAIRDYLYARMRGAREHSEPTLEAAAVGVGAPPLVASADGAPAAAPRPAGAESDLVTALQETAAALREAARALRDRGTA